SKWVSPTQIVPKKGGIQVVENQQGKLVVTRPQTGYRVCIDYRKLNEVTRKDHFPADFYILEMEHDNKSMHILLGRPFLKSARTKINVSTGSLTMELDGKIIHYNIHKAIELPFEEKYV